LLYILSLDTTAKTSSVCVSKFSEGHLSPICLAQLNSTLTHSESLLPMIDFCLSQARLTFDQIAVSAISAGPGSFTGVRIGIASVKGLAFAKELKETKNSVCIPVSTLYALALNLTGGKRGQILCPVMDARREQVYNALFSTDGKGNIKRLCKDRLITAEELFCELRETYPNKEIVLVGDGATLCDRLFEARKEEHPHIRLCDEAQLYQNAFSVAKAAVLTHDLEALCEAGKEEFSCAALSPVYLRASQAERERNKREN